MRQFDVFDNPSPEARRFAPYPVGLSSHLVLGFDDAVVAPLVSELASMAGRNLRERVASLADREDDIRRAIDRLFTGF